MSLGHYWHWLLAWCFCNNGDLCFPSCLQEMADEGLQPKKRSTMHANLTKKA